MPKRISPTSPINYVSVSRLSHFFFFINFDFLTILALYYFKRILVILFCFYFLLLLARQESCEMLQPLNAKCWNIYIYFFFGFCWFVARQHLCFCPSSSSPTTEPPPHRQPVTGIWLQILTQKCGNASGMQKSVCPHGGQKQKDAQRTTFACFNINVVEESNIIISQSFGALWAVTTFWWNT